MNIKFSQAISTRMACIDNEVQKAEREFLKDLQAVTKFDIQGETLHLYAGDQPILSFSRLSYLTAFEFGFEKEH